MRRFVGVAVAAGLALAALLVRAPASACPGDCDGDARVTIDELLRGVRMALGTTVAECAGLDAGGDGAVSIDELLRAVAVSLAGCPTPTATATPTSTPTVNQPPVLPTASLYRAFPGNEIAYAVGATDPNGDALLCTAESLPDGAALDERSGVLTWTPADDQIGVFEIPITCTDDGDPPAAAAGELSFLVSPLDACIIPNCDPASGCEVELPPPDEPCCEGLSGGRPEPTQVECPLGAAVFMGRDATGFRPLRNCDLYRVTNFAQTGAEVSFKLAARCVNTLNPVSVQIRMEAGGPCPRPTPERCRRPMVNFLQARAFLTAREDGSTEPTRLTPAQVMGGSGFQDLQDAEANLIVTLRDSDGLEVTQKVRLLLTFTPIPTPPNPSPTPTHTVSSGQ